MKYNIDAAPRVHLIATEDTATSIVDLTTKPERMCNISLETLDGARTMEIARNVPWAQGHMLKQAFEGVLDLALMVQDQRYNDPPPRRD